MDTTTTDQPILKEKKVNKYAGRYKEAARLNYIEKRESLLLYRKTRYEAKKDDIKEKARHIYNRGKSCEVELLKLRIAELENLVSETK